MVVAFDAATNGTFNHDTHDITAALRYCSRKRKTKMASSTLSATARFTTKSLIAVSLTASAAAAFLAATTSNNEQHRISAAPFHRRLNIPSTTHSVSSRPTVSPASDPLLRLKAAGLTALHSQFSSWMTRLLLNNKDDTTENEEDELLKDLDATVAISNTLQNRFQIDDSYVWLYKDKDGSPTSWEKYTVTEIIDCELDDDANDHDDHQHRHRHTFIVTIEMSTKFEEDEAYSTHHRIKANLTDHILNSHDSRDSWKIGFEYYDNSSDGEGKWRIFGDGDNVQAFEEKFDVFSMLLSSSSSNNNTRTTVANNDDKADEKEEELDLFPWASTRTQCDPMRHTRTVSLDVRTGTGDKDQQQEIMKENTNTTTTMNLTRTDRHQYTEAWYGPQNHDMLSGVALYKEFPNSQHAFSLIEMTRSRSREMTKNGAVATFVNDINIVV